MAKYKDWLIGRDSVPTAPFRENLNPYSQPLRSPPVEEQLAMLERFKQQELASGGNRFGGGAGGAATEYRDRLLSEQSPVGTSSKIEQAPKVKARNKMRKNNLISDYGFDSVIADDGPILPRRSPSTLKEGRFYWDATAPRGRKIGSRLKNPNILGPIGKLPMVGAIPLPSTVQQTAQDVQSPLLSPTEKMLRFLLRGTNEVASPAEEWRAKGGI